MKKCLFLPLLFIVSSLAYCSSPFSQLAWKQINPIVYKINKHPFNRQLLAGSLDPLLFSQFLNQDSYYLSIYDQITRRLQGQLTQQQKAYFFLPESIAEEATPKVRNQLGRLTMANYSYTHFLLAIEQQHKPAVILAAILPCQWLYQEAYQRKLENSKSNNRYQYWLKVYQSKSYTKTTNNLIRLANQMYDQADEKTKKEMLSAFVQASIFEYRFWDDVFRHNYMG